MFTLFNAQVKMPLYRHFPQHHGYCEPIGRSRAALFAKPVVAVEVQNENTGFGHLFNRYDCPDWLWYLHSRYLDRTRTAKKVYTQEMSNGDHRTLLDQILGLGGLVVVSGYPSRLYESALGDWQLITKQVPCYSLPATRASGRLSKPRRTECPLLNPAAWNCLCHWRSQSQTNPVVMAVKAKETQC